METLPEEIEDAVVDCLSLADIARLSGVSCNWRYICITHPGYSWWRQVLTEAPWDSSDEESCSCGCGADCDMFCYVDTYRWELRC